VFGEAGLSHFGELATPQSTQGIDPMTTTMTEAAPQTTTQAAAPAAKPKKLTRVTKLWRNESASGNVYFRGNFLKPLADAPLTPKQRKAFEELTNLRVLVFVDEANPDDLILHIETNPDQPPAKPKASGTKRQPSRAPVDPEAIAAGLDAPQAGQGTSVGVTADPDVF
jgi:hypothetical protein